MSRHAAHIQTHHKNVAARGIKTPSGWDAFGFPVPSYRKTAALEHYRDMNPDISTEDATRDIDKLSQFIERDEPYEMESYWRYEMSGAERHTNPRRALDFMGFIRLKAVLMTAPDPNEEPPAVEVVYTS